MQPILTMGTDGLEIRWPDETVGHFPFIWLRDTDPSGFHPETGERVFDLTRVSLDITPSDARLKEDALMITWPGQNAPSRFSLDWIKANRPGVRRADPAAVEPFIWRADTGAESVPRRNAATIATGDTAFAEWLEVTKRHGLSIVEGIGIDPEAGIKLARSIGHLRETNFGVTFEVVSKPDPNNLAYTADALPLHTDLTNQELPPGYQFLHCIANEAEGGGSTFCDGLAVATDLKDRDPEAFELLSTVTLPFRFQDAETDIRSRKAVITLDAEGEISEICFNAHIADIVDIDARQMPAFYRAYQHFMSMLRDPAYAIGLKLEGGEMVVFDNRRVLHGREAFDPATGKRHLRGCYVDRGEWDSRLRVLRRTKSDPAVH